MKNTVKTSLRLSLAALATAAIATISSTFAPVSAASLFDQTEVNQGDFIAIATPGGSLGHKLLILEQQRDTRACWSESGSNPTTVNLLLNDFNFSGICGRSSDSNGFSIRMAGDDLGLKYRLSIVERNGEFFLIGLPDDRNNPQLEIGRTYGVTSGSAKIYLNSGWRFTKRNYQGKTLGHVYLTNNLSLAAITGVEPTPGETPGPAPSFRDIAGDVYALEIEEAVEVGFISGFPEDNTFRPDVALTREQLVSMIVESLSQLPGVETEFFEGISDRPYFDVETSRWSAQKIAWAKNNNIISGYPDGTFRPAQPVTRAELMAVQRRAAEFARRMNGLNPDVTAKQQETNFSDTQNHWAESVISQMSAYCSVASPLNEIGSSFFPNERAKRNYAAAATLRMMKCVQSDLPN